jgi:serpin B
MGTCWRALCPTDTARKLGLESMSMIRSIALFLALFALGMVSPARPVAAREVPSTLAKPMAAASNGFGRRLYSSLASQGGNLFFSPYSVHAAMELTREGARGETAAEMDKALGLAGLERGRGYNDLVRALAPPRVEEGFGRNAKRVPAYALNIANALWGQSSYAIEKPFIDSLKKVYGAPLARVDFTAPGIARKAINDWVSKATRKRVQDIVPVGLPPKDARIALVNAIYFKARWEHTFEARATKEADFTGSDGKKSKAKMMHRLGQYRYAEVDGVQVLELPYRGGHLSMVVYLPGAHDGLAALEAKLAQGKLDAAERRKVRLVEVKLPKFHFTSFFDLTPVLPTLGMPRAFNARKADFSGITKQDPLFIGVVLHKAFVAVDEAGTEASAATVVMGKLGAAPRRQEKVEFRADRPFVFEIRHRGTGAILFAGRVARP